MSNHCIFVFFLLVNCKKTGGVVYGCTRRVRSVVVSFPAIRLSRPVEKNTKQTFLLIYCER